MVANDSKGKGGCFAAAGVGVVFLIVLILWTCFYKVPANAIGVRTLMSGGGIEKHDYTPGYVTCIPGLHRVKLWDPTWSNVYHPMDVRGGDGYKTSVDVSVIFRIHQGKCWEVAGKFPSYADIENRVRSSLSQYANAVLTQMKTEDFYNSEVRDKKTEEVQKLMDKQLEEYGLEVKSVMLRNIVYDKVFEEQLLKKQLSGQTLGLEECKTQQVAGEMATEKIEAEAAAEVVSIKETLKQDMANLTAETDQKVNKILQDAQFEANTVTAKATADKRKKVAKADFLRAEATAYGTAAMAKVYAKPGASFYFAQKALTGLKLGNIEVNSSTFNPLDADHLLKALGLDLHAPAPSSDSAGGSSSKK